MTVLSRNSLAALLIGFSVMPTAAVSDELHPCLIGLWQADMEDLSHVFAVVMGAESATASGDVRMRIFPNGNGSYLIDPLIVDLQMPNSPPMQITIEGDADFTIRSLDHFVYFESTGMSLNARADVLGQVLEIPIDGFLEGRQSGESGCTDTSLSIDVERLGGMPRSWARLPTPNSRSGLPDDDS